MKKGLSIGADLIVTMDADFSHHPKDVPLLIDAASRFDLVIGSRYIQGGGTRNCGWNRTLLSRGANWFARVALDLHALDCTAGFRCYKSAVLEQVPLDKIASNGYSFLIELLFLMQQQGCRVGEVPIMFENRRMGRSKISPVEILRAAQTVVRLGMGQRVISVMPDDHR